MTVPTRKDNEHKTVYLFQVMSFVFYFYFLFKHSVVRKEKVWYDIDSSVRN